MYDLGVYPESMEEDWRKSPSGDFVSRQWLLTEYDKRHKGPPGGARKMIEEAPPADVRPVVLCRDCENAKHWYSDKFRCYLWSESGIDVFADGFCSYGVTGGTP